MAGDVTQERCLARGNARLRVLVQRVLAQPVVYIERDTENRPDADEQHAEAAAERHYTQRRTPEQKPPACSNPRSPISPGKRVCTRPSARRPKQACNTSG